MTETCVILDIGGVLEITPETGWLERWEERLVAARHGARADGGGVAGRKRRTRR